MLQLCHCQLVGSAALRVLVLVPTLPFSVQERANKILGKNKPSIPAGIPLQLDMGEGTVNGLTGQGKQARAKPKGENIASKKARLAKVQTSTASLGKFDKKVSGEPGRPQYSSRKSRRSLMDTAGEKDRDVKTLKQILGGNMGEGYGTGSTAQSGVDFTKKSKRDGIITAAKAGGKKRRR